MRAKKDKLAEQLRTTRHGWVFHFPLIIGAAVFLLPLVWMLAISVKPLDQTMDPSFDPLPRAFYIETEDGRRIQVYREKLLAERRSLVKVTRAESKGLTGSTHWVLSKNVELEKGVAELDDGQLVETETYRTRLADGDLVEVEVLREKVVAEPGYLVKVARAQFGQLEGSTHWVRAADLDEKEKVLSLSDGREVRVKEARLADGQLVDVEVLRRVEGESPLWLVREWKDEDVDTKLVSAVQTDPDRYVDCVRPDRITRSIRPMWQNYPTALRRMNFWKALFNTLLVCVMGVLGVTTASVLVAYGLAFIDFKGRKLLFVVTLATMMIPFPATMVPLFGLFNKLGWVGSLKPLWVPAWFGSAFFIFLLRQFFLGIPKDLLDSARLAGASELQILWHVVLPLSRPALAMVGLFHFLYMWKDFMGPLIYLNGKERYTLSLALQNFHTEQGGTPWHLMMAASVVFSLPLIVLFFLTVKTFIRSITMTGLKG